MHIMSAHFPFRYNIFCVRICVYVYVCMYMWTSDFGFSIASVYGDPASVYGHPANVYGDRIARSPYTLAGSPCTLATPYRFKA